jgi:hypothetical protein
MINVLTYLRFSKYLYYLTLRVKYLKIYINICDTSVNGQYLNSMKTVGYNIFFYLVWPLQTGSLVGAW